MKEKFTKEHIVSTIKQIKLQEWLGYLWLLVALIYIIGNKLYLTGKDIVTYDTVKTVTHIENVNIGKIVCLAAAYLASVFCIHWKNTLSEEKEKRLILGITILSPFITFTIVELSYQSQYIKMRPMAILLNLFVLGFFTWFFAIVFNRFRPTVMLPVVIWYIYCLANVYVMRFRGFGLLLTDFSQVRSAMTVAGEYDYTLTYSETVMLLALVDFFVIVCKLENRRFFTTKKRLLAAVSIPVYALGIWAIVMQGTLMSKMGMKVNQYRPQKSYGGMGTALTIVGSARYLVLKAPETYSQENLAAVTEGYVSDRADQVNTKELPNLIVVMDEGFCDLEGQYQLDTSEETLPFFHSLKENVVEGNMYVSIFGGQTADTEYEFLTGNSMVFFSSGVVPYQSYLKANVPHISLTRNVEAMGYENTTAIHSFSPVGYNRIAAYSALGFDNFLTIDDFEEPLIYRKFISDESHFDKVIERYEEHRKHKKEEGPFYCFNVTMQNHSPFEEVFDNFDLDITVNDAQYADRADVRTYVNLVKKTDEAYEQLISYFQKVDEPTMIVIFGDHQPNIQMQYEEDVMLQRYQVPFKIWANYDIEERQVDKISPNYLGALVTELAGMPLTGYQKYLLDLYEEIPVMTRHGYITKDGELYCLL